MNPTTQEAEPSLTSSSASVERLAAVPLHPRRTATPSPVQQVPNQQNLHEAREQRINAKIQHNGKIIAVIHALSKIIAVRLYLFFTLIGAFVLADIALDKGTYIALAILVAYTVLTVIPLCILDDRLHRRPDQ